MTATRSKPHKHVITLEAFLAIPEVDPAFEFADGVVKQKMPPLGEHSVLQGELLRTLR